MSEQPTQQSHLFLIRIWLDGTPALTAADRGEWSGRVLHVLSGEARTFHGWPALIALLELAEADGGEAETSGAGPQQVGD